MGGGRLEKGGGAMGKIGQKDRLVQLEVMAPVFTRNVETSSNLSNNDSLEHHVRQHGD